ncbi:MAG: hypothetical protein IJD16_09755 [Desulfovibrio sp.]|nr:hypothetical protein [Desulfovibrio sp.]
MLFLLLLCLLCTSCAHKHAVIPDTPAPETIPTSPDASLASFIGHGAEGESRIFDDTSFGTSVTATIGKPYVSALGQSCRKAYISARSDKRLIAACRGEAQQWHLAPDIFVPGVF